MVLRHYWIKVILACEISVKHKNKRVHLLAYGYNPLFTKLVVPKLAYKRDYGDVLSLEKACKLIHLFGGKAIMAHSFKYIHDGKELVEEIVEDGDIDDFINDQNPSGKFFSSTGIK